MYIVSLYQIVIIIKIIFHSINFLLLMWFSITTASKLTQNNNTNLSNFFNYICSMRSSFFITFHFQNNNNLSNKLKISEENATKLENYQLTNENRISTLGKHCEELEKDAIQHLTASNYHQNEHQTTKNNHTVIIQDHHNTKKEIKNELLHLTQERGK